MEDRIYLTFPRIGCQWTAESNLLGWYICKCERQHLTSHKPHSTHCCSVLKERWCRVGVSPHSCFWGQFRVLKFTTPLCDADLKTEQRHGCQTNLFGVSTAPRVLCLNFEIETVEQAAVLRLHANLSVDVSQKNSTNPGMLVKCCKGCSRYTMEQL